MKKSTIILIGAICLGMLSGCGKGKALQPSEIPETKINADENITMATEYACYGQDAPQINLYVTNNTDEEYSCGLEYLLQKQEDGVWKNVPFRADMAWIEIAYVVTPNQTSSQIILLSDLDYVWTAGNYRIVKRMRDAYYAAAFEIGVSKITASTPFGFAALEKLPKAYSAVDAAVDGAAVFQLGGSKNAASVTAFLNNVLSGTPAMLRVGRVTVEGDLVLTDVLYNADGMDGFLCRTDNTRDAFAVEAGIFETHYSYLTTDGVNVCLSNYAKWNGENSADTSVLLFAEDDEASADWITLVHTMTENREGAGAITYKIFSPDGTWWACLTDLPLEFGYSNSESGAMQDVAAGGAQPTRIHGIDWVSDAAFVLSCSTEQPDIRFFAAFDVQKRMFTFTGYGSAYTTEGGVVRIAS